MTLGAPFTLTYRIRVVDLAAKHGGCRRCTTCGSLATLGASWPIVSHAGPARITVPVAALLIGG